MTAKAKELSPLDKAVHGLAVYLERGQEVEGLCERANAASVNVTEPASTLIAALHRRDVAFHNFLALEYLARAAGQDLAVDVRAQAIWQELRSVCPRLEASLESVITNGLTELSKMNRSRLGLAGYHSGRTFAAKLITFA